mmetsp:Transcript_58411/g.122007  ORF Transcript_58411/g.122007 Transcript_58411/m.122007 type:complete len:223 (+) Transcript_58411:1340-2008(+)
MIPHCRRRRSIAVSNEPAAMCSPGTLDACCHRCSAGVPMVGGAKKPAPPEADGVDLEVVGAPRSPKSKSSISQPPPPSPPPPPPSLPSSSPNRPPKAASSSLVPSSPRSRSSPPHPPPMSPSSSATAAVSTFCSPPPSKYPFETRKSGQLFSRKIGVGGNKRPALDGERIDSSTFSLIPVDSMSAPKSSASSVRPWVFAVIYARAGCWISFKIFTRSRASPR